MEHIFILIERTFGIFILCFAITFQMTQLRQWENTLRLLQIQVELEQDMGLIQE